MEKCTEIKEISFGIVTTLRCNLHCTDCGFGCYNNNTWDCDPYVTFETIKKLVKIKYTNTLNITIGICLLGGEPLVSPAFWTLVDLIAKENCLGDHIGVITNGLLLPKLPLDKIEMLIKSRMRLYVSVYPLEYNYTKLFNYTKSLGLLVTNLVSEIQEDLKVTTGVQEYFYSHIYRDKPRILKKDWDNIKECRSMIGGLVCTSVMNTKIYYCSNMIEVLNNQAFNKYKHIELKEPSDYVSVSKINSVKDLIPYLKGCYSLCHYCTDAVLTPWSTSIKVKQI